MSTDLKTLTADLVQAKKHLTELQCEAATTTNVERFDKLSVRYGLIDQAFAALSGYKQDVKHALTDATGLPAYMFLELLQ